jgi:hypothetical protein
MGVWLADDRPCFVEACPRLAELKVTIDRSECRFFLCIRHGTDGWKRMEVDGHRFDFSPEALEVVTRNPKRVRFIVHDLQKPQGCHAGRHPCVGAGPAL